MSLSIDAAPPGHLPPAASAPWPIQPPPHGAMAATIPVRPIERRRGAIGLVGALVAGAVTVTVALAVAAPLLLARRPQSDARGDRRRRAKA